MGGNPLCQMPPMNVGLNAYNQGNSSLGSMNMGSGNQGLNMGMGMGMHPSSMAFIGGMNGNNNANTNNHMG